MNNNHTIVFVLKKIKKRLIIEVNDRDDENAYMLRQHGSFNSPTGHSHEVKFDSEMSQNAEKLH